MAALNLKKPSNRRKRGSGSRWRASYKRYKSPTKNILNCAFTSHNLLHTDKSIDE
jgi:hypothetical protein